MQFWNHSLSLALARPYVSATGAVPYESLDKCRPDVQDFERILRGIISKAAGFHSFRFWRLRCVPDGSGFVAAGQKKRKETYMKQILFLLCGFGMAPFALIASGNISDSTMSNLQTAFNGESNAHARYLAFAAKADADGYAGAASLFRAAARAEEIHAGNHAAVIKTFGGVPVAKLEDPGVKSTRENLETALKGETYERDVMYPDFIRQARSEANREALRTLSFARAAEVEHARLYAEALQDLESMKPSHAFYVCPVCGFATENPDSEPCPTCATPKESFEKVS